VPGPDSAVINRFIKLLSAASAGFTRSDIIFFILRPDVYSGTICKVERFRAKKIAAISDSYLYLDNYYF